MPKKRQTKGQMKIPGVYAPLAPVPADPNELYDEVRTTLGGRPGSKREEYRGPKPAAHQPLPVAQNPEKPTKIEKRSLAERLKIFHEFHGFLPLSRDEATVGLILLDDLGTPFSTSRYLRDVQRHQSRPDTDIIDPNRTSLGLIRQFGNYAVDARYTRMFANDVAERLQGVRHNLTMLDVINSSGNDEPIYVDMLVPFFRHHAVRKAVDASAFIREDYEDMGSALDFEYMTAPIEGVYEERLLAFAGTMTVMGIRSNAEDMDTQHMYRRAFWDARVKEASNYLPGRKTAVAMVNGWDARAYYVEQPMPPDPAQAVNG